jgi:hypothetical protein
LTAVVVGPGTMLWVQREALVSLWLGSAPSSEVVAAYSGVLLPGSMLGALSFIPYALLLSRQDFRFQGVLSVALSMATLALVTLFSVRQSLISVCWAYTAYHSLSTVLQWLRVEWLDDMRVHSRAALAPCMAWALALALATGSLASLPFFFQHF